MPSQSSADEQYQDQILVEVSRTFALTIPELPPQLRRVVANAYLLCRIADTVEDDARMSPALKRQYTDRFIAVVEENGSPEEFARNLHPRLAPETPSAERDLIANTPAVIRITRGFNANQRRALARCIRIMAKGMAGFQEQETPDGLDDLPAMDRYCYYVAGVVGEMLTDLFCDYSPEIGRQRDRLMPLAVSFGQGLQMTNILKDIWEDHRRGACWLPRDVFEDTGFDLRRLRPGDADPAFAHGLARLIGIARGHLRHALTYTLAIPREETGIRRFCLWALGMAVLTLRKINRSRDFSAGKQVKISRRSVKATIAVTNLSVRHNRLLGMLFHAGTLDLPEAQIHGSIDKLTLGAKPP